MRARWFVRLFTVAFSSGLSYVLGLLLAPDFATTAATIGAICSTVSAVLVDRLVANYRGIIRRQNRRLAEQVDELEQLNQLLTESNVELRAFAHTVAHDLKNPITSVILNAEFMTELLEERLAAGDDLRQLQQTAAELEEGGRAMNGIIDDLLLLASVSQGEVDLRPVDMGQVVERAMPRLKKLIEQSRAQIELPTSWPVSQGYAPWLEQVWVNFLSNACKYGGSPPRIRVGATRTQSRVRYWVEDSGPGIGSEDCKLLFQEFTRLDPCRCEGHGLGLWIVRRIVERLGGRVGVESVVGQGSCFFFELPQAAIAQGARRENDQVSEELGAQPRYALRKDPWSAAQTVH